AARVALDRADRGDPVAPSDGRGEIGGGGLSVRVREGGEQVGGVRGAFGDREGSAGGGEGRVGDVNGEGGGLGGRGSAGDQESGGFVAGVGVGVWRGGDEIANAVGVDADGSGRVRAVAPVDNRVVGADWAL